MKYDKETFKRCNLFGISLPFGVPLWWDYCKKRPANKKVAENLTRTSLLLKCQIYLEDYTNWNMYILNIVDKWNECKLQGKH